MRCRLFHRWSQWGELIEGRKLWGGKPIGDVWLQRRVCERCSRVQVREVHS